MGTILEALTGPVGSLVGAVGGVIDSLHTSDEEKLTAKVALARMENELVVAIMEADAAFAKEQSEVLQAEIASTSWMARNWRPILMLTFTYIIAHVYVIAPLFGVPNVVIPEQMWTLLNIGIGGYVVGRSAEKIIPATKLAKD